MLKVQDQAPLSVEAMNQTGQPVSLQQVLNDNPGKHIVIYFYPKDNTPGCTTEACNFRDSSDELTKYNAVVIGVSKDSVDSHQKFAKKHSLPFSLWSDPNHVLMDAFGIWGERSFMGVKYMGATRSTFIIDPSGKIAAVWPKVKPSNHASEVVTFLQSVGKPGN